MLSTRFASLLLVGAATALVGAAGCTSSSTDKPTPNHRLLSDLDRDGFFSSEECDDPRPVIECGGPNSDDHQEPGDDGDTTATNTGCTVVPGPSECYFIDVSGSSPGSTGEVDPTDPDAPTTGGGTNPSTGEECYQCLDENGQPVGDPVCAPPNPISCTPVGGDEGEATCWTCTDGETTYEECYTPPQTCATDADCAEGESCITPNVACVPEEGPCPDIDYTPFCAGTGGGEDQPPPTPTPDPNGLPR